MPLLLPILAAVVAILFGAPVYAQSYPSKPITLVVPFGPGSATDTIADLDRNSARSQAECCGRESRPAQMERSRAVVARAAPDGHTLFMGTNSPHSAVPFLMKNLLTTQRRTLRRSRGWEATRSCWSYIPSIPATTVKS